MAGAFMEGASLFSFKEILLGVPFSFTLLFILGCHEFGHYFYAKKNNINVSLPYFIPAPTFIGTFGALIRIKSPIYTKKALLEIGASGPIAGFIVTVPLLIYGFSKSSVVELNSNSTLILGQSLLMKLFIFLFFPNLPDSQSIVLHPIAFACWIGLLITMLNLLPIGQLDGGHIIYAFFGKNHYKISRFFFIMLIPLSYFSLNWLVWCVIIIILMRTLKHPPIINDKLVLKFREKLIAFLCLLIFIICFVPAPFKV